MDIEPAAASEEARIRQVLYRYCRGVDRCDGGLIASCFAPQATVDYSGILVGSAEKFIDFVLTSHAALVAHSHLLGNITVTVHGTRAASEAYGHIVLWKHQGDAISEVVVRNRYLDRWTCQDGHWQITERLHVIDQRTVDGLPDPTVLTRQPGRHDTSDPSYDLLASPRAGAR